LENLIYKIMGRDDFIGAEKSGVFQGSAHDLADGFIHFSTKIQVRETAARHFAGQVDLVLLTIDAPSLPPDLLKWETARDGALFPHLYGSLPLNAVLCRHDLPLNSDGRHIFPAEI
jgi:uncharacterized protein (DUF952 family)